jgi:hypothetical protein
VALVARDRALEQAALAVLVLQVAVEGVVAQEEPHWQSTEVCELYDLSTHLNTINQGD